ncbi:MAG: filamentous hemagglutinin N-terminal domain-containing protein [Rhizobiaceae bacterium]|nr:filamentous hemagglutinin N-terminal domain-containing protein [Rhizobiaceae bacterium]
MSLATILARPWSAPSNRHTDLQKYGHFASTTSTLALAIALAASGHALAQELPSGGNVTAGTATIGTAGTSLLVSQTSNNAIISWESFSIGGGASAHFENGTGATLNRVRGPLASTIDGTLTSTGSVYLINPAGVAVGTGGMVRTGGSFVASAHDASDADFLDGGGLTLKGDSKAAVVNMGTISSLGGDVVLTARRVENTGTIDAPEGSAGLLAGYEVLLRDTSLADGKFAVKVGGDDTEVVNKGIIRAADVELRANGGNVQALAGNTKSVIKATGVKKSGGRIFLTAGSGGTVTTRQKMIARRAVAASQKQMVLDLPDEGPLPPTRPDFSGGEIHLAGRVVSVEGEVDASGAGETGGSIRITADLVSNAGALLAGGDSGGEVSIASRSVLSAGLVDVSGSEGAGGSVAVTASGSYVETVGGSIRADGKTAGGTISIGAERIFSSGSLSASSVEGMGGRIDLAAGDIDLVAATLRADGYTGGGLLRIGGDYQGGGSFRQASETTISPATILSADAIETGKGGKIIVWSTDATEFYGTASARGGAAAGDGGLIEISSKNNLVMGGFAQAGAPNGVNGLLLLDPKNLVIDEVTGTYPQYKLMDPNPNTDNNFGHTVVSLSTGNVVVTSPLDDFGASNAGAVYLFNEETGALLSALVGSTANDRVGIGGVTILSNANYVVQSYNWNDGTVVGAGAVTWADGNIGTSGIVSGANSLVGSTTGDNVGAVYALSNGNYVVRSYVWDNGSAVDAGAVTWGNGSTGTIGTISAANSLVGSTTGDNVGNGIYVLTNGNYVVGSASWSNGSAVDAGAVTWGDGESGVSGVVSAANSLVGSTTGDNVGNGIYVLTNDNYVVRSIGWDNGSIVNVGAVTWGDGTSGISGTVSATNSLVGSKVNDFVGWGGVTALTNGNYVVNSTLWDDGTTGYAGAVTWGNGSTGTVGIVSSANSLVGSKAYDQVGDGGVTALSNGNYVVRSIVWDNGSIVDAGAVTWGNGSTGTVGTISAANSLVGSRAGDRVGSSGVVALSNGNYVVRSTGWDNGLIVDAGAVTWGNGSTGTTGVVSSANSLVGSTEFDQLGLSGVVALSNGNYVVASHQWDNGPIANAGAVTWGNGSTGTTGVVSSANSLVGSTASNFVGIGGVTALTNGNYVVRSYYWDNGSIIDAGAVTWGNGSTGTVGAVSAANSLVGSTANDQVGSGGVYALSNGNYVVSSYNWDHGSIVNAGAVTWGSGTGSVSGVVSAANSLVGSTANDQVGIGSVYALSNGNYVVSSYNWDNGSAVDAGAVTWGSGTGGVSGIISTANSLVGNMAGDQLRYIVYPADSLTFKARSLNNSRNAILIGLTDINADNNGLTFSRATGQTVTITSAAVELILGTGTDLRLQASNDITVNSDVIVDNAAGDGGNFTLQAGRSILVNASIFTDNADLTLIANEKQDNGVVSADREAGAAFIDLSNAAIDAGMGNVSLTMEDGAGRANNGAGDILLGDITAGELSVTHAAPHGTMVTGFYGNVTTTGSQIYMGGLLVGQNIVLSAGEDGFVWEDEIDGQIVGENGGETIAVYEDGKLTRYGVMDTNDAARLALAQGAASRVYGDANPDAVSVALVSGTLRSGDQLDEIIDAAGIDVTWDAGSAPVANTNVGNYGFTAEANSSFGLQSGKQGYFVSTTTVDGALDITQRSISIATAGTVAGTKVYDATTDIDVLTNGTLSGVLGGDTVTVSLAAAYDDKNVGAGKSVTGSYALAGTDAGNYQLTSDAFAGSADITRASLSIATAGTVANTKVYDTTTDIAVLTNGSLSGVLGGDTVTVSLTAAYDDKNVGDDKAVNGSYALTGTDAGNYQLSSAAFTSSADITRASLSVATAGTVAGTKVYDATTGIVVESNGALSGVLSLDDVGLSLTAAYDDKNVGDGKTVTGSYALTGTDAGNYQLSSAAFTSSADITRASLSVATAGTVANTKVYDATTDIAVLTNGSLSGVLGGDTVTVSLAAAYDDKNVGDGKAVTGSYALAGADALNYQLTSDAFAGSADITRASLSIATAGTVANTKVYDATTDIAVLTNGSLSGVLGSDTVTVSLAAAYDDKNVGDDKAVNGSYALTGTDAGNYQLSSAVFTSSADITRASLSVSAHPGQHKTYGEADPLLSWTATGFVGGENSSLMTGTLSRQPGENVAAYAIEQGTLSAGGNYQITYVGADFVINQRAITVTAEDRMKIEGDPDPALTWAVTAGTFAFADTSASVLSGTLARDPGEAVGNYAITQGSLEANGNYVLTFLPGIFTITSGDAPELGEPGSFVVERSLPGYLNIFLEPLEGESQDEVCSKGVLGPDCASNVHPDNRRIGRHVAWMGQPAE